MAFIETSGTIKVDITFKFAPGQAYGGKVESVLQAVATGQAQPSGAAVLPKAIETVPFAVRVKLDEPFARKLPAAAPLTATHVIRRVLLRQVAILNYVNPF
jgi:hypothetical protein